MLSKKEELTDFEKKVAKAIKAAIKYKKEAEKAGNYKVEEAMIFRDSKRKLFLSESGALTFGDYAIGMALKYFTEENKIPLSREKYKDIFLFALDRLLLHIWLNEHEEVFKKSFFEKINLTKIFINKKIRNDDIKIDDDVKEIIQIEDEFGMQKTFLRADLLKAGYSREEAKEIIKNTLFSSINFGEKVKSDSMKKILENWLEAQKKLSEKIKKIRNELKLKKSIEERYKMQTEEDNDNRKEKRF